MRTIAPSEQETERAADPALDDAVERLLALMTAVGRRRSLRDPIAAACEDLQLTAPQIHAIGWLGSDETLTMGELARRLCISEKTATGVVDRLELAGTVRRERDASDRRVVRVRLTDDGRKLALDIDTHVREMLGRALILLDAPRREALFDILETLLQRMEQEAVRADGVTDHS